MSASVFSLNDADFKALLIFVLNAAISLHPLAKEPEAASEITKMFQNRLHYKSPNFL